MSYRNGNYTAFYVSEPFSEFSLNAYATPDFVYYNLLRAWKGSDSSFPFNDSHNKNYNVRDNSDWELTLKPRLRERIRNSKNLILLLSSVTKNSRALREEIDYAINNQSLPIIIIYPEYKTEESILNEGFLRKEIIKLWDNLPIFRDSMGKVPTLHIPLNKETITKALNEKGFMVSTKIKNDIYRYSHAYS